MSVALAVQVPRAACMNPDRVAIGWFGWARMAGQRPMKNDSGPAGGGRAVADSRGEGGGQ
jgi:hypothetical protein